MKLLVTGSIPVGLTMAKRKTVHYVHGCPWASGNIQQSDTAQTKDKTKVTCFRCVFRCTKPYTFVEGKRIPCWCAER